MPTVKDALRMKLKASNWKRDPGTPFPLPPETVSAAIPVYIGIDTTADAINPDTLPLNEYRALIPLNEYRALVSVSESSDQPSKGEKIMRNTEKLVRETFNSRMRKATRAEKALAVLEQEGIGLPEDTRSQVNRQTERALTDILMSLNKP